MCGGTNPGLTVSYILTGLSPRVRGNPSSSWFDKSGAGSIPACAGEPVNFVYLVKLHGVYPRVCGGTFWIARGDFLITGLSPRVRGNHSVLVPNGTGNRSIPACAGEPPRQVGCSGRIKVYPRVCGGTRLVEGVRALCDGLSPRVRGNHGRLGHRRRPVRSIPACAGEPWDFPPETSAKKVYPRVCGGTSSPSDASPSDSGLSPRVRGNRASRVLSRLGNGSIPACAGEPRWIRRRE